MVTPPEMEERTGPPAYSLETVRQWAEEGRVDYASPDVFKDTDNFGYDLDRVCDCLTRLAATDYHKSVLYPGQKRWMDVYLTKHVYSETRADELYIKLQLSMQRLVITLCSFHPEGAL